MMREEVPLHLVTLQSHHSVLVMHEVFNRQAFTQRVVDSVKTSLEKPGIVKSCLAQALAGNGAGVYKNPARKFAAIHHAYFLSKVGSLGGAFFSSRAGTNYD